MKIVFSFLFLLFTTVSISQISGDWHSSCYDHPMTDFTMKLKGNVKSWTMVKPNGESRTMTFDKNGNLLTDTYKGTIQTFVPPDFMLIQLKNQYEKKQVQKTKTDSSVKHNDRMQLLEWNEKNYFQKNTFDNSGNILIHQETSSTVETRAWNSIHHESPTYSYTLKTGKLVVFRYNNKGSLKEVEYFHSDPFQNLKMVYIYDQQNNLIETNRYDDNNIRGMRDNYLDTIFKSQIDTSFSIERFYKNYWGGGSPAVNKWKYNENGQKIEYTAYGYMKGLSFKATWEYDEKGHVAKEIQYDVYRDKIKNTIEFDQKGNVIRETRPGAPGKEALITEMKITYY